MSKITPWTLYALLLLGVGAARAQPADSGGDGDQPSGGGYGCVANGNCPGTLYKDSKVRSEWWYGYCSGCHQLAPNPRARRVSADELRRGTSDAERFWSFHENSVRDPHWQRTLEEFQRPIPTRQLRPEFRRLLEAQPRTRE